MMQSSKDSVRERMRDLTATCDISAAEQIQASQIANSLHLSRSMASTYLNALHKDGVLVKVSSRPTLFFDRSTLEERFGINIQQDTFLSTTELMRYIDARQVARYDFQDLIGANGSLKGIIDQAKAAVCYPPFGLPCLLHGADELGKYELRRALCRWCVSAGIVKSEAAVRVIEADELVRSVNSVADALEAGAIVDLFAGIELLWVLNCQDLDDATWELLFALQTGTADALHRCGVAAAHQSKWGFLRNASASDAISGFRLFLDCPGDPAALIHPVYLRRIPVVEAYPAFSVRAMDEREACVYRLFQHEASHIGCRVLVSASVLKRLVALDAEDGLSSLQRTVRMACANALAAGTVHDAGGEAIRVLHAHVPVGQPGLFEDELSHREPTFIDVSRYDPLQRGSDVLQALQCFLEELATCSAAEDESDSSVESALFQRLSKYFELLNNGRRGFARSPLDHLLAHASERVFERYGVGEPVGFVPHLAAALAFFRENRLAIEAFRARGGASLVGRARDVATRCYGYEDSIVASLSGSLQDYLGSGLESENRVAFAFYLHWCLRERKVRCAGVVVSHGYSTATSIADAVNTMLRQHVFDALDVPLDVSTEEVERELDRYVTKMAFS